MSNQPVSSTRDILEQYVPSDELRSIVVSAIHGKLPNASQVFDKVWVDNLISSGVRGLISTLGLALDRDKNDTFAITENGLLTQAVIESYHVRLPVPPDMIAYLMKAITADLYRCAGHPALRMASAQLEVRGGELVVVGLEVHRQFAPGEKHRVTIAMLD